MKRKQDLHLQDKHIVEAQICHISVNVSDESGVINIGSYSPQTKHRVATVIWGKEKNGSFTKLSSNCKTFQMLQSIRQTHHSPPLFLKWSESFHISGIRKSAKTKQQNMKTRPEQKPEVCVSHQHPSLHPDFAPSLFFLAGGGE